MSQNPPGPDNFLSKAFADGKVFVKTVNLMTQLSKLKVAVSNKRKERDKIVRQIGVNIFEHYSETRNLESNAITNLVIDDLHAIQEIDESIVDLQAQMEQVKADFRAQQSQKKDQQQDK